jgi:hypothetical protein
MRRALIVALPALVATLALAGCGKDTPKQAPTVNTDLAALKRFIKLPDDVTRAEWQTGTMAEHGGDWWVAAVLDAPADAQPRLLAGPGQPGTLDTPPGMQATASFAALKALPGTTPAGDDRLRLTGDLHGVEPFASSPLLHGRALRLSATQVFVLLWTN